MTAVERPSNDILVLKLSPYHSLDLVRLPATRRYRIVFAERSGVQKRAFIEVSFEQAMLVAKFLASIDNAPRDVDSIPEVIEREITHRERNLKPSP